jgi:hypothetical protein
VPLDELAASIRAQVNTAVFAGIAARMTPAEVAVADGLLEVDPVRRRSDFDRLKTVAPAASVQRFKDHLKHLAWLDSFGAADAWLAGVPPAKVAHFAGRPESPTWPTCAAMRRRRSGRWWPR